MLRSQGDSLRAAASIHGDARAAARADAEDERQDQRDDPVAEAAEAGVHEARLDRAFRDKDKKQAQRELPRPSGKRQQEGHLAVGQRDRLEQPQATNPILLLAVRQHAAGTAAFSEGDHQIKEEARSRLNGNLPQHSPFHS